MSKRRKKRESEEPKVEPAPTVAQPARPISARKKWLFRVLALTVIPTLFLLLFEGVLRVGGYGYATSYFLKTSIDDQQYLAGNPEFTLRFFSRALARELDRPMLRTEKPAGSTRIFVFGDSAAQGDPDPHFAFSRILEKMLCERYPNRNFEVINTAVTAINSNVVVPIARECGRLAPDFFVIYMGNNEVIGPYGPATVFTSASQNLSFIRAALALKTTRIGQLLDSMVTRSANGKSPDEWGGMTMFLGNRIRHDDPRMAPVYDHFRENLYDIAHSGLNGGAQIIVCTLGVNLKDCAPFASMHRSDLSDANEKKFKALYDEGAGLESQKQFDPALLKYAQAEKIDHTFAELQYRIGRCQLALSQSADAKAAFSKARDFDALPFRAKSQLIQIMREAPNNIDSSRVKLADAAAAYEQDSASGIPGDNVFYEHVHMNAHGNYIAAKTVLAQLEQSLGESKTPALSESACMDAIGFTDWEHLRIDNEMLSRINAAPFTDQLGHADQVRQYEAEIKRLRETQSSERTAAIEQKYRDAIKRYPDDWRLRELLGRFLIEGRNDASAALAEFRAVLKAIPFDYHAHQNVAIALRESKHEDEAGLEFQAALRIKPDYIDALCALAALRASQQRPADAQALYTQALNFQPLSREAHGGLGRILEDQLRFDEALEHYSKARYSNQQMGMVHNRIAVAHMKSGRTDGALNEFKKAAELYPDYAEVQFNLGNAFSQKGDKDSALKYFMEAARLKPDLAEAHSQIGNIYLNKHQPDRAIDAFQTAVRLKPEMAAAQNSLGVALASQGRLNEAIVHFAEALRVRPDMIEARQNLERARAGMGQR